MRGAHLVALVLAVATSPCSSLLCGARTPALRSVTPSRSGLEHVVCGRKGRPKMPAGGQAYAQQQSAPQPSPDGMPMFYLYCRSGAGKPWYPVSAMKGDGQSKGLINAWLGSPWAKGVFKDRLDAGMARSIFESERRLASLAVEQYGHMKDMKQKLQWGYKIIYNELAVKEAAGEIEKQKIIAVSKDMVSEGGILDQAKKAFNL